MFWRTRRCLGARLDSVNVFFQFMAFQGAFLAASRPPWSKLEAILALSGVSWGAPGTVFERFSGAFLERLLWSARATYQMMILHRFGS